MKFFNGAATWLLAGGVLAATGYATMRPEAPIAGADSQVATERRPIDAGVTSVVLDGPIDLTLRQGSPATLAVRAETRLLPNIVTALDGTRLRIATRGMLLHPRHPIQVLLTLPALTVLRTSGSGATEASGFTGPNLQLALDGSGKLRFDGHYAAATITLHGSGPLDYAGGAADTITLDAIGSGRAQLSGSAATLHATLRGSGELDAHDLAADAVTIVQQGSGDSRVTARRGVSVQLSGSGKVEVAGKPASRTVRREGSGAVLFTD